MEIEKSIGEKMAENCLHLRLRHIGYVENRKIYFCNDCFNYLMGEWG